ncbi:signal peptidase II [Salinibacterium sp. G-O1]|uniref:signal peptidase II n=1 Tax=Salinibacterium sp. G-O1 TaxID=3046208 RepID=UPI0024BAADBC|nr:signal peptidase II [Salinibacterium sp. G-O1]MDJ0335000.1 signal peptidase II [Salinibacterium sp. G-O1]
MPETNPQQATASKREISARALVVLAVVAVLAYVADRISKILVVENLTLGQPVDVLGNLLQFHYVENPGAAFSLGSGSTWIFAIIAAVVAVFIIFFARRIRSTGWAVLFGLLLGGNLGNLTDRLTRPPGFGVGHVVDFLQVYGFPAIFNVADISIVSSMGLFILLTIRGVGLDGTRTPPKAKTSQPAADDESASSAQSPTDPA